MNERNSKIVFIVGGIIAILIIGNFVISLPRKRRVAFDSMIAELEQDGHTLIKATIGEPLIEIEITAIEFHDMVESSTWVIYYNNLVFHMFSDDFGIAFKFNWNNAWLNDGRFWEKLK